MDETNDRPGTPVSDFMKNIMEDDANGFVHPARRLLLDDFDGNTVIPQDQVVEAPQEILGLAFEQS